MPIAREAILGRVLSAHLDRLVEATREWSRGTDPDQETEAVRRTAIGINHLRYLELVPVYGQLAKAEGVSAEAGLETLINRMMFADRLFKSYEPEWLRAGDFASLTAWLAGRFVRTPRVDLAGVTDIRSWREQLKSDWVFVACSSGTSGRLSFIPRDAATLAALKTNGAAYPHPVWPAVAGGAHREYDCLVLGVGDTMFGLAAAGTGLARSAVRSHFLTDDATVEAAYAACAAFARESARTRRPLVVFGAPFQIRRFCRFIAETTGRLETAWGSLVVSGGGWKTFRGEEVSRDHLRQLIDRTLGVGGEHTIDAYSTAELNCAFMSCSFDRYHIPPLVEPVVLDEALEGEVGAAGSGVLGVLDPFARSYPGFLITGDRCVLARDRCPCGLAGWSIVGPIRRAEREEVKGCGGTVTAFRP